MRFLFIIALTIVLSLGCRVNYHSESMPRISTMTIEEARLHLAREQAELLVLQEQKEQQQKEYEDAAETFNRFEDNWDRTYSKAVSDARFALRCTMGEISSTEQNIAALKVRLDIGVCRPTE